MQDEAHQFPSRRAMLTGALSGALLAAPSSAFAQAAPQSSSELRTNPGSGNVDSEFKWLQANGTSLRYQVVGSGDATVVLIHEMASGLETWNEILPEIARRRRILRYDFRGFGLSERIRGKITYEDHAQDLLALLDTLQIIQPVTLVGSAIGAAIAVQFAATYPNRVKAFVALSPAVSLEPRAAFLAVAEKIQEIGLRAYMDKWNEDIYPKALRTNARWARYRGMERSADQESVISTIQMLAAGGFKDILPNVKCPALVVHTSLWTRPEAEIRKLAELMPLGQFTVIEAGHFSALEAPEMVLPILTRFLESGG